MLIYPGKLTKGNSFRIGTIGDINEENIRSLAKEVQAYLTEKSIKLQ
jgi:aspartate aminotransferase-like enzyme